MPVKFKNHVPVHSQETVADAKHIVAKIKASLGLSDGAKVSPGVSTTTVVYKGITIELPFGTSHVNGGNAKYFSTLSSFASLVDIPLHMTAQTPEASKDYSVNVVGATGPEAIVPAPAPAPIVSGDMDDEAWAEAVAADLFPGVISLHKAKTCYQRVQGTSGNSVYLSAFIGPHVRGAIRIKDTHVSMRFTSHLNLCPEEDVKNILVRLGLNSVYDDRITGHFAMSGPLAEYPAEYRALLGSFYAALRPYLTSNFPNPLKLLNGTS